MGFDNECILNIESLAGEYFCPVCRTLVYPQEAVQAQCTHLYCKPCLSYVVSSTQACPYDGYLVTEATSKPLMESNKVVAETIGKTTVHCLYHRSGCVWQGALSDCTPHCSACAFGNSPVVCNRCGIQIVHRQVQEHAQTCNVNGTNTQPQGAQDAADQSKIVNQTVAPTSQPQTIAAQPPTLNPVPQTAPPTAMSAPDQQYYQQYYQQYPGYDPYQQAYQQQYYPYQQPPPQQVQQVQAPIPQVQPQAQPQIPSNGQPQPVYPQPVGQVNPQPYVQPVAHGHMPPVQSYSQVQPQYQQMHPSQPPQMIPQAPPHLHYQPHQQMQPVPQPHQQMQPAPQPHQQMQPVPSHQHPMQVQQSGPVPPGQMPAQYPPPPPHTRPPQPPHMLPAQPTLPAHQHPVMHQVQQPIPQQYMQQPQPFSGQLSGQFQGQPPHTVPYPQQHSQIRPPGPPQPMQQPLGFVQPQQGPALPHGMPPHSSQAYVARPALPPQARPPQFGPVTVVNQPHVYPGQEPNQYAPPPLGQQEEKSPSLKKTDPVANDIGPNLSEVKPESGEQKHADVDQMKKEELTKYTVSESATTQRVKEESKDGALDQNKADNVKQEETSQTDNGNSQGQTLTANQGQISDVSGGFPNKGNEQGWSPHAPYGQQQRPAQTQGQPPRPPGHGYMPHGSHPGEHFQPPGPFQPEVPFGGPPGPGPNRGYESDLYQNQRPLSYDNRRPDSSHYGPPYNGGPPPGVDSSSAPVYRDRSYPDTFPPTRHQPYMGREDSPRFRERDPHGYDGRFDDNRQQNPEFHGFGRPNPFGNERHPFGERFPMHRREFDGGSFGPSNGPFGESFGSKSRRPHLGEPGFRSSYSRHGFPNDGGFYAGGPDSLRKRKTISMGWCRICKVDCESVEGLDMHGQTREHQRMAMDMVISIKQKNSKNQKRASNEREEGRKFRDSYAC